MKILYISTVCSPKIIDILFSSKHSKPLQSIQKFNSLIVDGFINNGIEVQVYSYIPVKPSDIKLFWFKKKEIYKRIVYNYFPFINVKYFNHISVLISSFFIIFFWLLRQKNKKEITVCFDVLIVPIAIGGLWASKIFNIATVGIVTDVPGMLNEKCKNITSQIYTNLNKSYLRRFDKYVLLTEQMNDLVNPRKKPHIVMEGLADLKMNEFPKLKKHAEKVIIYAGGLYEIYGVKMLIEAFMKLKDPSIRLHLYGHGPMVKTISHYTDFDNRIKYFGIVPNEVVVKDEIKATLLVNPRPSSEEYTKYSFPSKNMEYMVSGTAVLTSNLPGMPKEYHKYVFIYEDESIDGLYFKLKELLIHTDISHLYEKGEKAKKFILENKNNTIQSKRIIDFIK